MCFDLTFYTKESHRSFLMDHLLIIFSFIVCEITTMSSQNQNRSLEQAGPSGSGGQVGVRVVNWSGSDRLCISPKRDHKPENYDDLQFEFNPNIFASLEHYLPPHMLNLSRDVKLHYIRNILLRYLPENDRIWVHLFFN